MSTPIKQFHDELISLNICFLELSEEFLRYSKTSSNEPSGHTTLK